MWVAQVHSYLGKSTKSCIFFVFHTSWMAHALFHHHFILVCTGAAPEKGVSTFSLSSAIHSWLCSLTYLCTHVSTQRKTQVDELSPYNSFQSAPVPLLRLQHRGLSWHENAARIWNEIGNSWDYWDHLFPQDALTTLTD